MVRLATRRTVAVVLVAVLVPLTGCSRSSDDEETKKAERGEVLVGEVDGGKALIALVHTAQGVTVYACGFDEQLGTHTGWFNGVPTTEGKDRVIPELANPNGLRLRGRITGGGGKATGTLTLTSGEEVAWSAARASGNGAGLYAAEDAASLAGLIVAEDERMVGSTLFRLPTSGTGTSTPTTLATTTTTARLGTTTTTARPATTTTLSRLATTTTTSSSKVATTTTTSRLTPTTTTTARSATTTTTAKPAATTTTTTKPATTTTAKPATTTTTAQPATPTTTAPASGTTVPQTTTLPILVPEERPTGQPVVVTVPLEQPRLTTVTPVTKPRTVTREGAAIVFLVHGMSDSTGTPGAAEGFDATACVGPRNTPFYSRCEWGPDFLPGLFGGREGAALANLAGGDMTGNRYITSAQRVAQIDETLGMAQATNGCAADPTQPEDVDLEKDRPAAHFITAPGDGSIGGTFPIPPRLSVFTTYRDSTRGVVESGRRVARQAYAAARWWEETFKETPSIIFVTQSFGGLATRFVLSNPTDASLDGLNPDGVTICPEDHARMDYLRNRTAYALTLATPHEGSFLAEVGEPGKVFLRGALAEIDAGLANNDLARITKSVEDVAALALDNPPSVLDLARRQIADLLALLDTPALRDMKLANMVRWNTGPIAPDRARRTAASPMVGAANELVPIYATLARSPGSHSFDTPEILDAFKVYEKERPKEQGWVQGTAIQSQLLVKQFSDVGWGRVDGALAPHVAVLDRRAPIFDLSDPTAAAERFVEQAAEDILGKPAAYFEGEFGSGVDGIVNFLDSVDVESFFPTVVVPIYTEHVWVIDLSGSVEVPMIGFACGAERIVLDYEPLVRALLAVHARVPDALAAIGSGDLRAVLDAARVAASDGVPLAEQTMDWFKGKLADLDALEGDCKVPLDADDLVSDFFSVANLANWRVVRTSGRVPAPALVETDEVSRDGEQDNDGAVHAASALGFQLGREPFFFEHDHGGSWYRLADNPVAEKYNHGLQYQNDVARFVRDRFFAAGVGPVPQADGDSAWTQ